MRNDQGDIDIAEYLERLPDKGKCLVAPASVVYIEDRSLVATLDKPYLSGPPGSVVECSSCVSVAVTPEVIWDVNAYYRELGFSFPYTHISRRQMRLNFFARDGPNSVRLTFILKQLLRESTRDKYDRTPLGELFLDEWVQKSLKDKAMREARRRSAETGESVQVEDVLSEWGMEVQDVEPEDETRYGEDPEQPSPKDTSDSPESSDPPHQIVPWTWAYYLWRTQENDTERLGLWQQLLVSALAVRQARHRFAVGFFGKRPQRYLVGDVDGRDVFFLNEDQEPTEELAAVAVVQMLYDQHRQVVTGARHGQLPQGRQAG